MWGAVAAAAGSLAGQYMAGQSSASAQKSANKMNLKIAQQQMQFQERMSNTAHQREIADLRAAGLNPMLSGMGGQGASAPSGASAQMVAEDPQYGAAIETGISTAMETRRLKKELESTDSQIQLNKAQEAAIQATKAKTDTETTLLKKSVPKAEIQADLWNKAKGLYDSSAKRFKDWSDSERKNYENRDTNKKLH